MNKNVLEYLENSAVKYPDKVAVADPKSSLTYAELLESAKNAGAALLPYVKMGEAVPVLADKSCKMLVVFLGAVMAGGFYTMVEPSHPVDRINSILGTLEAGMVVVSADKRSKLEKCRFTGTALDMDELLAHKATDEELAALSKIREEHLDIDPLYAIFTSGSTGVPKGVVVNHRSVIDFIDEFTEIFDITENDVIGNQAPFDFDVSVKDIYSALKTGARLQIIPKQMFSFPVKLLDYLEENNVTTLVWAVSALCIITTFKGFTYKIPSSINKVIFSGEVMPIKHLNEWRNAYPNAKFVNVYGPTEITCNCTYYVVDRDYEPDEILPMGKAFPNERVFLLDDDDNLISPATANVNGEVCVSGTAVTLGYYNNEEKTEQAFVQNPLNNKFKEIIYRTGDLAYYNEDGLLCFSSRKDFQIKHMGHRIELTGIDASMNAIAGVERACCVFHKDENKILGFYTGTADKKEIVKGLMEKLPKFMVPQEFVNVEKMPLTKNGKIDRNELLAEYIRSEEINNA
jgi:amino acid adenylation domain-containing protein